MDETQRVLINIQSKLAQLGIEYDLNTEDMLLRFFIASKGVIASIFEILAEALRFSDGDITYKAFEDTFNFIKGSEEINPFLVKSSSLGNLCAEVLKKIDGHEEKKSQKMDHKLVIRPCIKENESLIGYAMRLADENAQMSFSRFLKNSDCFSQHLGFSSIFLAPLVVKLSKRTGHAIAIDSNFIDTESKCDWLESPQYAPNALKQMVSTAQNGSINTTLIALYMVMI
ncbi:hypothetical protein P4S73_02210 [Paraglaciecola sp. Hal342]